MTPPTGTRGSVFTFTGSGFESNAISCSAAIIPAISPTAPGCFISTGIGQVAGSVTATSTAVSGTYGIVVTDNTGATATGFFTVGTPSALLVLNPASVQQSQPVGVAATGLNPDDTSCTITAGGAPPWTVAPDCSISGGYASGSFTVSDTAPGGYYLITVTGNSGDFASNFLAVELQSTVTTYSTTSTTTSSSTTVSTTTTSVATSILLLKHNSPDHRHLLHYLHATNLNHGLWNNNNFTKRHNNINRDSDKCSADNNNSFHDSIVWSTAMRIRNQVSGYKSEYESGTVR